MMPIGLGAEYRVQEVGRTVDDLGMLGEVRRRIDAAEHLDDAQAIECAMAIVNGTEHIDGTFAGSGLAFFDGQVLAESPFDLAGESGCVEQLAGTNTPVEIGRLRLFEFDAERLGPFLRAVLFTFFSLREDAIFLPSPIRRVARGGGVGLPGL